VRKVSKVDILWIGLSPFYVKVSNLSTVKSEQLQFFDSKSRSGIKPQAMGPALDPGGCVIANQGHTATHKESRKVCAVHGGR
jgi:hypothetical protein